MISYIIGDIRAISEESFVIENNNIGYLIRTSLSTLSRVEINNEYKIYTTMQVREDDISLYGFYSKEELELFELLITVSTIGPKNGIGILSALSVNDIKKAIVNNDIDLLTKAKGVGKKTASRIVLELVDKVKTMPYKENMNIIKDDPSNEDYMVAKDALINLGYQQNDIDHVLLELRDLDLSLEGLIKESLKRLI